MPQKSHKITQSVTLDELYVYYLYLMDYIQPVNYEVLTRCWVHNLGEKLSE